jgi:hypothetical protein
MQDKKELRIKTDALGRVYMAEVLWLICGSRWKLRRMIAAGEFPGPSAGLGRGEKHKWCSKAVHAWAEAQPGYAWQNKK